MRRALAGRGSSVLPERKTGSTTDREGGGPASLLITLLISSAHRATLLIMRFQRPTNAPNPLLITGSWGNDRTDRDTSESFAVYARRTYRVQVAPFCAHLATAPSGAGDPL